jgi:hypothetical protein
VKRAAAWLGGVVATLLLLEAGAAALVTLGILETPAPSYGGTGFWRGHHPDFGVWHEPDAQISHERACFRVVYRTNSVGARDVERPLESETPRVVVLGDSFIEGWGIPSDARLSNLLERATGLPHLNFGMAHFSPYQHVIVYRKLASRFDHDAVVVGLLPANDFLDLDLERADLRERYEYRYRPYLVGDPPDLRHFDHVESASSRALRNRSYAWNALLEGTHALRALGGEDESSEVAGSGRRPMSRFYDFSDADFGRLEAVLVRLAQAVDGKPTAVLLIPTERDLERRAVSGPAPLVDRLERVGARLGLRVIDLLTPFSESALDYSAYYLRCDYHWSVRGNAVAAEWVLGALEPEWYGRLR